MGTAMRFVAGVAGLLLTAIGLAMSASILGQVLIDPFDIDLPAGPLIPTLMGLLVGAAPLAVGFVLLRKAIRGGRHPRTATPVAPSVAPPLRPLALDPVALSAPPIRSHPEASAVAIPEANAEAISALPEAREEQLPIDDASEATPRRRTWLAMIGLAIALLALFVEITAVGVTIQNGIDTGGGWTGLILFMAVAAIPLAVGLWLAHRSDPGIARRFVSDLAGFVSRMRRRETLLAGVRTSIGLGAALAIVSVPLILVSGQASILVALASLTVFSLIDPALNFRRSSWWLGAVLSAGTWLALFAVLTGAANAVEPMREGGMVFMLPMMIFPGALALSGLARLWMWVVRLSGG